MLGAYQDSRPKKAGDAPKVKFGLKDLFVFAIYMAMAVPFGPIMHYIFGSWATPVAYETELTSNNWWGWEYMRVQSYQSDHRWYLLMVLQARLYMQLCEYGRVAGWFQIILAILPLFGPKEAWDVCAADSTSPVFWKYMGSWVFRNFGSGCPVYVRWFQVYLIFYVACFHYLRPFVEWGKGKLPTGAAWSAAAGGASMCIGVMMGLWHYPNYALENGSGLQWIWWEMFIDFTQPTLFALAMASFPYNMAWWGNTTLGCYTFHFYFRDTFTKLFITSQSWFTWDPTGLLFPIFNIGICCLFTTFIGPLCHYLLLSPTFLYQRVQKVRKIKAAEQAAVGKDVK